MKLYGYRKEHYDYMKDNVRKEGDNVTLYFGYKIPVNEGQGVCALSYNCDSRLSRAILEGRKPIVIGADYDLIPNQYGNLTELFIHEDGGGGGKENKK